jgi:GDSL-like Lipase/Acylhydrolase family/HYR domain
LSAGKLWFAAALLGVLACSGGCGGSPNNPSPPPVLSITCPANTSMQSLDGNPAGVSFDLPQPIGGTAPVTTTCTPPSGSQFPVGSSTVVCQARDSGSQVSSCSFSVVVTAPPRLTATRFLAFGDSLTAGVLSPTVTLMIVSPPGSYPFQLEGRLVARYRQQTPVVLNEGNPGELVSDTGVRRFRSVLQATRPEVVLLMEGSNDLLFGQAGADAAISALGTMVREAKGQGVRIALATIPPQRAGGLRGRDAVVRLWLPPRASRSSRSSTACRATTRSSASTICT